MNEDGSFNLLVGATDLGTGSDTIMAQIASEELETDVSKILVYSSDTDMTPFDDRSLCIKYYLFERRSL